MGQGLLGISSSEGPGLCRMLDTDFYDEALLVKPTWWLQRGIESPLKGRFYVNPPGGHGTLLPSHA